MFCRCFRVFFAALILLPFIGCYENLCAVESERILKFNSRIRVETDASLTVTEKIQVVCSGNKIKRGIYRDFPTTYPSRFMFTTQVGFTVLEVLRDDKSEPYHIENIANGKRVYIGRKNVILKPGTYTYTLTYKTDRQLGFFDDYDELYWNVNGNDWDFVIEKMTAVVELPKEAEVLRRAAYTGLKGEKGRLFKIGSDRYGNVVFKTTELLSPKEGLTIAVAWEKGFVKKPTYKEKANYIIGDNRSLIMAFAGLIVLLIYYMAAWLMVGKDPQKGTIIPLFKPPAKLSPAAIRFINSMGFDKKCFTAAIVNLAVNGLLVIEEEGGNYKLKKVFGDPTSLSTGEKKARQKLFDADDTIELKQKNHQNLQKAISELKTSLKTELEKTYFLLNRKYFIPGVILTILTVIGIVLGSHDLAAATFMGVWLTIWTLGCSLLAVLIYSSWKEALGEKKGKKASKGTPIFLTFFGLPFFFGEIMGLWIFSSNVSVFSTLILLMIIGINIVFYQLLKAPTVYGRKIMDEIEGFKLYLSVAEKDRLNILNPPEKTPRLFEKYLPFALALGVENEWSEQFASILSKASMDNTYQPGWYSGRFTGPSGISGIASSIGSSLDGAVSSASASPGSSSGSGGGGSSGGGGGGGGGGGW